MVTILRDSDQFYENEGSQSQKKGSTEFFDNFAKVEAEEDKNEKGVPELPVEIQSAREDTKGKIFEIEREDDWMSQLLPDSKEEKDTSDIEKVSSEENTSIESEPDLEPDEGSPFIVRGRQAILPDGVTEEDIEKASDELAKDVDIKDINTSFTTDPGEMLEIGKKKIYTGNLSYEEYKNMHTEDRPERVDGDLLFSDCTSVKGDKLPKRVDGSVYAEGLKSIEEINLMLSQIKEIKGNLFISKEVVKNYVDRTEIKIQGVQGVLFTR